MSARQVREGWIYDPECHRATYRNRLALEIARTAGAGPTVRHDPAGTRQGMELLPRHECVNTHGEIEGGREERGCAYVWPAWVSDAVLSAIFDAADAIQSARGDYNRAAAYRAHDAKRGA